MKIVRHDGSQECHAVVAMATNKQVLATVAPNWEPNSFASRWANIVAGWCVQHYLDHGDVPGPAGITAIFDGWKETNPENADMMEKWLSSLPEQSDLNTDFAIEMIAKQVQKVSVKRLGNTLVNLTNDGKVEEAVDAVSAWKAPKIAQDASGVFPLQDTNLIAQALEKAQGTPLIEYSGALGEFIQPVMTQDAFVAFLAPEKSGKTTTLLDTTARAIAQGRRVAFLSCGDMSQEQVLVRLIPRFCKNPLGGGSFNVPVSLAHTNKEAAVEWKRITGRAVSQDQAVEAFKAVGGNDPNRFRLLTYPAGTISAFDISALVERWADDGWVPEVLVIDYADILAGPKGIREVYDQINMNWQELRALSTRARCLVVTATQSDTEGYSTWLLSKKNFSDCKKKIAHVTAMIGLNMTETERRQQVTRYNYVALREAEFMLGRPPFVAVAGCTKIGRPAMLSAWPT